MKQLPPRYQSRVAALITITRGLAEVVYPSEDICSKIPGADQLAELFDLDPDAFDDFGRLVQIVSVGNAMGFIAGTVPSELAEPLAEAVVAALEEERHGASADLNDAANRYAKGKADGMDEPDVIGGWILFRLCQSQRVELDDQIKLITRPLARYLGIFIINATARFWEDI